MAIVSRTQLKAWFRRGLKPLEVQFHSWIDSYWHKNDSIPMSSVDGLNDALNQRTISIDSALSDTSTNPVQNKVVTIALGDKQDNTDDSLPTTDKTIAGAIKELWNKFAYYALSNHNHDGVYQPAGSYAAANHNHDDAYAAKNHNHDGVYLTQHQDISGKQDKTDNTLATTAKTIVGAINELLNKFANYALSNHNHDNDYAAKNHNHDGVYLTQHQDISGKQDVITDLATIRSNSQLAATRAYTLDFGTGAELIQDVNMLGAITINRLVARNVAHLYVTYGNVSHQEINLAQAVSLNIPDGEVVSWEIVRTTDDALAAVGVRFSINSSNA